MSPIKDFSIPLIFKNIHKFKQNGELVVQSDKIQKHFYFSQGNMIFAKTNVLSERLGMILFKMKKISKSQFDEIPKLVENQKEKMGKIFVQKKWISSQDLFLALCVQMKIIAASTFGFPSGEWNFIEKNPQIPSDSIISIEIPEIIMEGIKKIQDVDSFRQKFLNQSLNIHPVPESICLYFSPQETDFFNRISQLNHVNSSQVLSISGMNEDQFWKQTFLFYLMNIIDFEKTTHNYAIEQKIEEINQLYERISNGKMKVSELFELRLRENSQNVDVTYNELSQRFDPETLGIPVTSEIEQKAYTILEQIKNHYIDLKSGDQDQWPQKISADKKNKAIQEVASPAPAPVEPAQAIPEEPVAISVAKTEAENQAINSLFDASELAPPDHHSPATVETNTISVAGPSSGNLPDTNTASDNLQWVETALNEQSEEDASLIEQTMQSWGEVPADQNLDHMNIPDNPEKASVTEMAPASEEMPAPPVDNSTRLFPVPPAQEIAMAKVHNEPPPAAREEAPPDLPRISGAHLDDAKPVDPEETAEDLFIQGKSLYENQQFNEAAERLNKAVQLDGTKATYYFQLGLAQINVPELNGTAEKNLRRAVEIDPWNEETLFILGELYRSRQLNTDAHRCFKKVLFINPENTLASKYIEELASGQ